MLAALFTAAGVERSETHYAEKRWGREMASKRRKSGLSGKKEDGELENSFVGKMGEEEEDRTRPPLSHGRRKIVRAPVI